MYFAVIGKNPEISIAELQRIHPENISYPKKSIIVFDTKYPELISQLGGIIKAGQVVKEKDLPQLLQDTKIIGIKEETNGKHLKKTIGIRRFKVVDIFHTDKEIKTKGKELINLENGFYGIVEQYQNIELYEMIDFGKPRRSMQMGMMPAKLTHIMINIGLQSIKSKVESQKSDLQNLQPSKPSTLVYDPFVGSGTTGFLANYLGYDFIGSDIKTNYAEQNMIWRKTTKFYHSDKHIDIFHHDITQTLVWPPLLKEEVSAGADGGFNLTIVTEGRLGPIVTKTTSAQDIQKFQEQVWRLYKSFVERIKEIGPAKAVFTIPWYLGHDNFLQQKITEFGGQIGLHITDIPELYKRTGQQVARKILIIQ